MVPNMETSMPPLDSFLETFEVKSSTASSIYLSWHVQGSSLPFVESFVVHYQRLASTYIQYGPRLPSTSKEFQITNLVADTYYKVCLVTNRNDTAPLRECIDASTTNWQLPVSIGSSIGAILALSMIVFIALLSRCRLPHFRRKHKTDSGKYNTMSSNFHEDHFDFSDTMTQGHEDDLMSDQGLEETVSQHETPCMCSIEHQYKHSSQRTGERLCHGNGMIKPNVHPSAAHQHQNQHQHSQPQPQPHSHHHPHIGASGRSFSQDHSSKRPIRANSIQSDDQYIPTGPAPNIRVGGGRRHSEVKEWRHLNDTTLENFKRLPETTLTELISPRDKFREYYNKESAKVHSFSSPAAAETVTPPPAADIKEHDANRNQPTSNSKPRISKTNTQELTFIDEGSLSSGSLTDSRDGARPKTTFEDLSSYGATGGSGLIDEYKMEIFESSSESPVTWDNPRSVEMTSKLHRNGAPPDTSAMDEHTV